MNRLVNVSDLLFALTVINLLYQHGVDTAKYYQQAERELEADRIAKAGSA